jgi:hypothetical protein
MSKEKYVESAWNKYFVTRMVEDRNPCVIPGEVKEASKAPTF